MQKINSKQNGGFWEEIGRVTLGVAGDTLSISGLTLKKYNRVIYKIIPSGVVSVGLRFNNDSGANYAFRYRASNAEGSAVSQTNIASLGGASNEGTIEFHNNSTHNKQCITNSVNGTNASTAPDYTLIWGFWANTAAITRVDLLNLGAGDFAIGTEMIILGHD